VLKTIESFEHEPIKRVVVKCEDIEIGRIVKNGAEDKASYIPSKRHARFHLHKELLEYIIGIIDTVEKSYPQ